MLYSDVEISTVKMKPIFPIAESLGFSLKFQGNHALTNCYNNAGHKHGDANPSLALYQDTNRFYCFGCGVKGDVIDLVKTVNHCSFREAVTYVDPTTSIKHKTPHEKPYQKRKQKEKGYKTPQTTKDVSESDLKLTNPYSQIYEDLFIESEDEGSRMSEEAFQYMQGRGFSEDTIYHSDAFTVNDPQEVIQKLQRTYSEEDLKGSGLIRKDKKGQYYYTFSHHPLIFPFMQKGRIVYLQGRTLDPKRKDKYRQIAGHGLPLYNKEFVDFYPRGERVYVTEGIIDALSMHEILSLNDRKKGNDPIKAVVGILGTQNFREAYIPFLSGYKEIVLCLDNDKAGKEASKQIKKKLLSSKGEDQKIFIHNLDVYEDVNEFLQDKKKTKV